MWLLDTKEKTLAGRVRVNDALAENSCLRQEGVNIGPVHIGQFQYGKKTGINTGTWLFSSLVVAMEDISRELNNIM